ncbi:MAG: hypothetical protein OHK0046_47390 [Anaerolineae bacterium]
MIVKINFNAQPVTVEIQERITEKTYRGEIGEIADVHIEVKFEPLFWHTLGALLRVLEGDEYRRTEIWGARQHHITDEIQRMAIWGIVLTAIAELGG